MPSPRPVVLLTDFGPGFYVGELKSRLAELSPGSMLIDLTHDIPAGQVRAGAFVLGACLDSLPKKAVVLAVVDPGVGSSRAGLALRSGGRDFVGPDNGLFSAVLEDSKTRARRLKEPWAPSARAFHTFQGRDLFAPAAASLARGASFEALGPRLPRPLRLEGLIHPVSGKGQVQGEIAWVDAFGNLLSSLSSGSRPQGRVQFRGRDIRMVAHYAQARKGEVVALWESHGFLEIARRDGSAAQALGAGLGDSLRFAPFKRGRR